MRKTGLCVILLTILFSLLIFAPAYAEQARVVGDEVNVRTGPGSVYGSFASLDSGTTVEVINRSNADWYLVSWGGNSGYVASQFLELIVEDSPVPYTVASQPETPGYITGMYVSLRSGPDTSYTILGTYSTGKTLMITGSSGEWIAVRIDGKDGFVHRDYVSEGAPAVSEPQNEAVVFSDQPVLQTVGQEPVADGQSLLLMDADPQSSGNSSPASVPETESSLPSSEAGLQTSVPSASVPSPGSVSAASVPEASPQPMSSTDGQAAEITANAVRLRSGPGTTYSIVGSFDKGTRVSVSGAADKWYAVSADQKSGYVYSDYVRILAADTDPIVSDSASSEVRPLSSPDPSAFRVTDGYIVGSSVRLRESPSMTARILAELNFGTAVKMTGLSGDWTKVICSGQEGYVSSAYVTEGVFEPATKVSAAKGTNLGKEIAAYALNYVGTPYRWGGSSPATGFDCSGFVQYVFSQFGYTTSRVANDVTSDGIHVDPSDIQPGDILCFYSGNNYVGHVGIYIGDNMFVHAANSSVGVVTTSLSTGYYSSRGYEIRRMT